MKSCRVIAILILFAVARVPSFGQTAGMQSFQGLVKDDSGLPIEGPITLEFRIFDSETGGNMVAGPFGPTSATAQEGLVSTKFGPVPTSAFDGNERWLEVRLDGSVLPRLEFVTPPATAEQLNRPGSGESAIYVDNIGRVGIGTTSPAHYLHIQADPDHSSDAAVTMTSRQGYTWSLGIDDSDGGTLKFATTPSGFNSGVKLVIDSLGRMGLGTVPSNMLDIITPNFDDEFNVGMRMSRANPGTTELRIGNYMKSAHIRQGGLIKANESLTLAYNSANEGFEFNIFNGISDSWVDTAQPVFSCKSDGSTEMRVLRILGGSDLAEPFNVASSNIDKSRVIPGMVTTIDPSHPGSLKVSSKPYDSGVAGIISGANDLSPGMVMKAEGDPFADGEHPIALTGRVWCWCDASPAQIQPGDRLTTSTTPGHAMKAIDASRAVGSVIGKAMTPLQEGRGLVLVLVQPQ